MEESVPPIQEVARISVSQTAQDEALTSYLVNSNFERSFRE